MGAQWKNQAKSQNSAKRGAIISKLVKEIIVAAKLGGAEIEHNSRLRAAVEAARKQSVPRDTIERGIKKGAGLLDEQVAFETIVYEGFTPHQVPIIVECLTDNRTRTASNIRSIFKQAHLGSSGSVMWMFDHLGVIEATHKNKGLDIESVAIEAGAQNVEPLDAQDIEAGIGARFFCEPTDLDTVNKYLTKAGWAISQSEMNYIAKNYPDINAEQRKEIGEFLSEVDDNDDVHRIYVALK